MERTAAQRLRAYGLHCTAQRIAVLEALERAPHGTADQVAAEARAALGAISRQAVYDALNALADRQLVRRVQTDGAATHYDPRVDVHHHLVCRACGRIEDVERASAELAPGVPADFVIDETEITYWGSCTSCRPPLPGA